MNSYLKQPTYEGRVLTLVNSYIAAKGLRHKCYGSFKSHKSILEKRLDPQFPFVCVWPEKQVLIDLSRCTLRISKKTQKKNLWGVQYFQTTLNKATQSTSSIHQLAQFIVVACYLQLKGDNDTLSYNIRAPANFPQIVKALVSTRKLPRYLVLQVVSFVQESKAARIMLTPALVAATPQVESEIVDTSLPQPTPIPIDPKTTIDVPEDVKSWEELADS